MPRKLEVQIVGDARSLERAFGRAQTHATRFGETMRKVGRTAEVAGAAIAAGAVLGVEKSLKAAADAQVAQSRLAAAFKSSGLSANKYAGLLDKAEARSRALGFAGNETRDALGSLVVATHSAQKSVSMLAVAEDLARFKHVDLANATKMLTSASAGNARAIKQLGILLVPLTSHVDALKNAHVKASTAAGRLEYAHAKLQDKMATAAHAVDLVREKVLGQGKAFASTASGSLQVFHEELQHIEVTLGSKLLPALTTAAQGASDFLDWIGRIGRVGSVSVAIDIIGKDLKSFGMRIKRSIEGAISGTDWKSVGTQLATAIGSGISFSSNALNNMLGSILGWVNAHTNQIADIGATLAVKMALTLTDPTFWAHHMDLLVGVIAIAFGGAVGRFGGVAGRILTKTLGPVFERAAGEVALLFMRGVARLPSALGDAIAAATPIIGRAISGLWSAIIGTSAKEGSRLIGLFGRVFRLGAVVTVFRLALSELRGAWSAFSGAFTGAFRTAVSTVLTVLDKLLGGLQAVAGVRIFGHRIFGNTADVIGGVREQVRGLRDEINLVGRKKVAAHVGVTISYTIGGRPRPSPGLGDGAVYAHGDLTRRIGDGAASYVRAHPPALPSAAGMATATGNAAGLKPMILDDLALGRSMGLHLSSGYRPGAITSSGNVSLHSVGQAIDMVGSRTQMTRYALAEAGRSGIAEVIYSPVGWWHPGSGWGPVTDPTIKAAHYSHVHVGARSGDGRVGAFGDGRRGVKKKPAPKHVGPHLPSSIDLAVTRARQTPTRTDDIAALGREETWIEAQLHRHDLTAGERTSLQKKLITVRGQIARYRAQEARQRQRQRQRAARRSTDVNVPQSLQLRRARARLSGPGSGAGGVSGLDDDINAAVAELEWIRQQMRRPGLSAGRKTALYNAYADLSDEIAGLQRDRNDALNQGAASGAATDTGTGDAAAVDDTADLQAQLAQANARAAASSEGEALANAFVSTGVFATQTPAGAAGVINVFPSVFPPTAEQVRQAGGIVAEAAGSQGYRVASSEALGV